MENHKWALRPLAFVGFALSASEAGQFLASATKVLGAQQWEWIALARTLARKRPTNAAAEGDKKNGVEPGTRSPRRLAERGGVRVVVHAHGQTGQLMEPVAKGKFRPAVDLMGTTDFASLPIHRPAEAGADGARRMRRDQFRQCGLDLPPDTLTAFARRDGESAALHDVRRRVTDHQLQFGAADFNSKE